MQHLLSQGNKITEFAENGKAERCQVFLRHSLRERILNLKMIVRSSLNPTHNKRKSFFHAHFNANNYQPLATNKCKVFDRSSDTPTNNESE